MRELFREEGERKLNEGERKRARDEGGSGETLDSEVSPEPGWRVLYAAR
jgi:hypothetical protein